MHSYHYDMKPLISMSNDVAGLMIRITIRKGEALYLTGELVSSIGLVHKARHRRPSGTWCLVSPEKFRCKQDRWSCVSLVSWIAILTTATM